MSIKKEIKKKNMSGNFQNLLKEIKKSDVYEIEVVRDLISEQIHQLMETQNINKAELARRLKTSTPYITKLLQGNGNFTIETLVKIAGAFGCKFVPAFSWPQPVWGNLGEVTKAAATRVTASEGYEVEYTERAEDYSANKVKIERAKDYSANKMKVKGSNNEGNSTITG